MQTVFKLYKADIKYIRNLHNITYQNLQSKF